jgi:phosphoribosylanthranilate isomerase
VPIRVKICGIKSPEDAEMAAQLGADAIGLNFYDKSPRFVEREMAMSILRVLPPFVTPVGVLVESGGRAREIIDSINLPVLQLHGHARADFPLVEQTEVRSQHVILAYAITAEASLTELAQLVELWRVTVKTPLAFLADGHVVGLHGGTGQTAPWDLLARHEFDLPLILAGGLTPDNVADAIRIVRPYAVDVASGVERAPGVKDEEKLRRFIGKAREAAEKFGTRT